MARTSSELPRAPGAGLRAEGKFPDSLPEARFVLSRGKVLETYRRLSQVADFVSYSHKTNPEVARVLETETDCTFGLHTWEGVALIKEKGRIWFFAQGWDNAEIGRLLAAGVRSFVVDNRNDLETLTTYCEKKAPGEKVNLLLRMRLREHTIHTGKYFVYGLYSDEVNKLIPLLRPKPYLGKLGIHFHRKTQNVSEWFLREEIEEALFPETLSAIDYVNIGGGIPAQYKNYQVELLEGILSRIREFRAWLNSRKIKMIVEPGRFIAAPAVRLEAYVKNIYGNNVILNCSVYNSFMDSVILNLRLLVEGEIELEKWEEDKLKAREKETPHSKHQGTSANQGEGCHEYLLKGCTPDSFDIFRYKVLLPQELKRGDKVVFLNAGAYNFYTECHQLPKLKTIVVD